MNSSESLSKNLEMESLKQSLVSEFSDIEFLKEGPASKSDDKKTDVVWKVLSEDINWEENFVKWFTKTGKVFWKTEHGLIELFNQFSEERNSSFSWPTILEEWKTEDGWYFFRMKDAKQWGKKELDFSKMKPEEIMNLYDEYRQTFDEFEKYSKWKTSTESNPALQKIYSLSNKYRNNIMFELVWNPALKMAVEKKYKNKISERILNGEGNVRSCGIDANKEKINKSLDTLLSKINNLDFEYNFWRFWTWHVFSDGTNHKLVDFDNVSYQIKWTEVLGIMWSNLLMSVWDYNSYEEWKSDYDKWYQKLLDTYEDKNLVKLLLFVKLVWTIFEDYGNLIYKREIWGEKGWQENGNFEKIRRWVEWNYKALQELMEED